MANTYVDYTGADGTGTDGKDFLFSFEYLRDDHVKVKVNDVIVINYTIVTSPVQLIRFDTAPTASAAIKIYRDSRGDFSPLVDFVDGSVLTENELDESYKHNLFVAQEASEGQGGEQLTKKGLTNYDAEGNKIINLGTPTANNDAANKAYVDQTIDNAELVGGSPATVSLGAYDVTSTNDTIKQLRAWTADIEINASNIATNTSNISNASNSNVTATGSTTARSLANRFADVVNVLDYGASPSETASNNATYIKNAIEASENKTLIFENGTYLVDQLIVSSSNITILGNHATIKYTEEVNSSSLRLTNARIMDLIIDGGNFNIGENNTQNAYNSAPIRANGDYFVAENVTVKNLQGKENQFQYGIVCDPYAKSIIRNCNFENIKTKTNTANTGGFCGGYYMYSHTGFSMRQSTHLIEGCTFKDIYTTQNAAGDLYSDSDGVRSTFQDKGTGNASYDAAVEQTVITVSDCSFLNVLKSGCKLNHASVSIRNCNVTVDDVKSEGQTNSYVGFRYQVGYYVSITNCSIVGLNRAGLLVNADNSYVQNVYVGMSDVVGTIQAGAIIGSVSDTNNATSIDGLVLNGTDAALEISGSDDVYVNNSKLEGYVSFIKLGELKIANSSLTHMIENTLFAIYDPYVSKVVISNCTVDFTGNDNRYCNNILSSTVFDFVISQVKIKESRAEFILAREVTSGSIGGPLGHNIKIEDCNIDITSTYTAATDRFLEYNGSGTMRIIDTKISDLRTTTPGVLIYTDSTTKLVEIDGFTFTANTSGGYNTAIYLSSTGNNRTFRNLIFNDLPSDTLCIYIGVGAYPSVSNIRANYTDAKMAFHSNVKAVVNMFHGSLKASPNHITATGGTVVSEYNTTFF